MTSRAPHSLQVISALGMGGAETWLMEILRLWSRTGEARMDFVATSGQAGVFDEEARQLGAKIHYIPFGRSRMAGFVHGFRRLLSENRYDAIHDHQDYPSGWHFLSGAGLLPPIRVTHVHNPAYQILNNNGLTPSKRLASRVGKTLVRRFATHITGTSRQLIGEYGFDARAFTSVPKAALYCGFDPARFQGDRDAAGLYLRKQFSWPTNAKVVLFAGRMDQSADCSAPQNHKNSAFAVSIAIAAAARDERVHMVMVGETSQARETLQARIDQAGLSGRIQFAGIRRDIELLMLGSDLLFFPSRGEGLGMVAVEAQAAGLPVLASTAVPRECVVAPALVSFLDLSAGDEIWVSTLLSLLDRPVGGLQGARLVADSPFAITNSARALRDLYATGRLART